MGSNVALPQPTTDLDRAKADFAEHGYCLVANAISTADAGAIRDRLVGLAAEEAANGTAFIDTDGVNQRVWQLLNKGDAFCELATHPLALELMDHIMGGHPQLGFQDGLPQYLLGSITANIAAPGGQLMALHADQFYVPLPWPDFPLVTNINWMLDDFTADNGATRIVPGSHRLTPPIPPDAAERVVAAEGPAGTALVFDGRVWHGTGQNTTDQRRHGILAYYCKPWMRQQENSAASLAPEVRATASPALRRLAGFDLYSSLGMVNGVGSPMDLIPEALRPAE